jgi:hypothetical protein
MCTSFVSGFVRFLLLLVIIFTYVLYMPSCHDVYKLLFYICIIEGIKSHFHAVTVQTNLKDTNCEW